MLRKLFAPARARGFARPRLEALEGRCVPATLPLGFSESAVATGLTSPTAMALAPDGKLFILEQAGTAEVWQNGTRVEANFFADTGLTPAVVDDDGERGLLGLAFDPDYATNRYVYAYYTVDGGAGASHNRVSRFTANDGGTKALSSTEVALLDLADLSSATNHNGGALHFGADGMLYVAVGENANPPLSQDLSSLFGKVLRLDVDDADLIPADNPFVGVMGARGEVWARGLRNPYTVAVEPGTGRILVNDVGGARWEEINDLAKGANYGWPATEGPFDVAAFPAFTNPLFAYPHPGVAASPTTGFAVIGGAFQDDGAGLFPTDYEGGYYFADFATGFIKRLDLATRQVKDFATGVGRPVDLKAAADGRLLYLSRQDGAVYAVTFTAPASGLLPDGSVGTASERFVAGLYRTVLGRPLSLGEQVGGALAAHAAYVDRFGREAFGRLIATSDEARAVQVRGLYQGLLKRGADAGGLAAFVGAMRRGATYDVIRVWMLSSPEYAARFGGDVGALLRGVYLDLLGRAIDPAGEGLFLPALQGRTMTVADVATVIVNSPEARGVKVDELYREQLGRAADPDGRAFWAGLLSAGLPDEAVLGGIVASAEYFNREVL